MGSPTPSFPDLDPPAPTDSVREDSFAAHLPPPPDVPELVFGDPGEFWRREPKRRYIILFALTLVTTTLVGGFWYSLPVLAILGAHEFGHYLACVYYRVNASLPYFIPFPLPPSGTLGAVIRIRQPIPGKRALFDIGIAGPIAGFLMLIPFLIIGVGMSNIGPMPNPKPEDILELGDPLLLTIVARFVLGPIREGQTLFIHPMGMAAWFGMLATSLNLFPIGQLDGGHITYAVLGRRSTTVTLVMASVLVGLALFVSWSWLVWTALIIAMLVMLGPQHPRVSDEHVPIDRARMGLAAFAVVMLVLCFTPAPMESRSLVHVVLDYFAHR
jgi:membrane-associated protease RseP (regulator of RpoE activity)